MTTMKRRSCVQFCERAICNTVAYFPLLFVVGASSWAVWALVNLSLLPDRRFGSLSIFLGVSCYILLNWSYLTAVFTPPGSPQTSSHTMNSDTLASSVTVKSNGQLRYCKKCQCPKPDRAHHCSTCRSCVLKMDHHCPWLATCVGLRNYKPFLLFVVYTSLFGWICFWTSAGWMLDEVLGSGSPGHIGQIGERTEAMLIHFVILSVISGIIGLVISGFSAYHIYLTIKNRTTLESLEKTRYLSPLKTMVARRLEEGGRGTSGRGMNGEDEGEHRYRNGNILGRPSFGEQLREMGTTLTEIHANALPGVLRPEEGEEEDVELAQGQTNDTAAVTSLRRYLHETALDDEERQYAQYLDDRDNDRLPNAFDLGWKRNIYAVLGPNPWLWFLPICNSQGDGWNWEKNENWARMRDELRWERERDFRERRMGDGVDWRQNYHAGNGNAPTGEIVDSSDEEEDDQGKQQQRRLLRQSVANKPQRQNWNSSTGMQDWNDIPDDMLSGSARR